MKVLLVDDDLTMRTLVSKVLESESHMVAACASGAEAIQRLEEERYAAMITDLVMPGIDGLELIRKAHALDEGLRCIIVSGHGPSPERETRPDVTWLSKPIDLDVLLEALEAAA